jgi:2-phosphosulfolactate phosphatase
MDSALDVIFTPAEVAALARRDLSATACVVFDVLRATSSIVTALAHGAVAVIPAADIPEALAVRRARPEVLLAGERDGVRIGTAVSGGVEFELGNSPREFVAKRVQGRTLVMTTTNGTRALRACAGARFVWAGAFLNLSALVRRVEQARPARLLLVGSGTGEEAALEDTLAAGALVEALDRIYPAERVSDAALMARQLYRQCSGDLAGALALSRNGRRLLARPELRADVAFCAQRDQFDLVPELAAGMLRGRPAV